MSTVEGTAPIAEVLRVGSREVSGVARSEEQNRLARERTREGILRSAIELFAEQGVHETTIAEITRGAGVAQGLVNYHFGGKDQLVGAVADRWYETLIGLAHGQGAPGETDADARLRGVIDAALIAAVVHRSLQRVMLSLAHQPSTRRIVAESEQRHSDAVQFAEQAVRSIFAERGAADPALEEGMLRTLLEGIAGRYAASDGSFPIDAARRWVHLQYGLGEPVGGLPSE